MIQTASRARAEVGVGVYHACLRMEAGTIKCWGDDGYGNLGGAERGDHAEPADVAQMSDAAQLAVGSYHVCVVRQTGAFLITRHGITST